MTERESPEVAKDPHHDLTPADRFDGVNSSHEAINQGMLDLFDFLAASDAQEDWKADGCRCMVEWICFHLKTTKDTAAAWLRAAHALAGLPHIKQAFSDGLLSWDQLRWLVELATPETDEHWATWGPGEAASKLRRTARHKRRIDRLEAERASRSRFVRSYWDQATGMFRMWAQLPPAEGAVVEKALERAGEAQPAKEEGSDLHRPFAHRMADGFVQMCSASLSADSDKDRATVVLHLEADALRGRANGEIAPAIPIPPEVVQRLTCDSRVQAAIHDPTGQVVGIGRTSRTIPPWLWRQVLHRDGGCVFPGCGSVRFLQGHHTIPWIEGGPTDLEHIAAVCTFHHHLVHEGGWKTQGTASDLTFIRPDGRVYRVRAGPHAA